MIKTIYVMNINNYLNHIICFIKDCPKISSVGVVQVACVFRTEIFSRGLILFSDNDTFFYCMIFCGVFAFNSMEFLALLEYLKATPSDVFIPPCLQSLSSSPLLLQYM